MSLNKTLAELKTKLRGNISGSASSSQMQSFESVMNVKLARCQEWLYTEVDWEHLVYYSEDTINPGQRYYSFNTDMNFERITEAWVRYPTTLWREIGYKITPDNYNYSNPDLNVRSDPILKWQHYVQLGDDPSIGQYEVWPLPATTQLLRFKGIRNLRPLVNDTDRCDIDDNLIVLFVAAEMLKKLKASEAKDVQTVAERMLDKIKGQYNKIGPFVKGGGLEHRHYDRTIRIQGT